MTDFVVRTTTSGWARRGLVAQRAGHLGMRMLAQLLHAISHDDASSRHLGEGDDGNGEEADACNTMCIAATCEDGLQNDLETDVDCGGGVCDTCGRARGLRR